MGRMNERTNMYPGRCAYCLETVEAETGFVFDDLARGWRKKVRHTGCNEATEEARIAEVARGGNAWCAAATGTPPPSRKATLEEAAEAVIPHTAIGDDAEALDAMLGEALGDAVGALGEEVARQWLEKVPPLVDHLLASRRKVEIIIGDMPAINMDTTHKALEDVLLMVLAGASPFLVGPAGSGKTTLASQIAEALDRKFYMAARVTSEYKLVGFMDANGNCVRTQFREAFEHGGVFLFDEVDASDPDAMTAFNAALANGWCDFPDGMINKHEDFVALAAGNTFGRGADRQYVGRNQLDAATLDRFQVYEVEYDEELEIVLAGNGPWVKYVQAVRASILDNKVRHVVSPRASIMGARLLAAGMELSKVIESCVWKGLDADTISHVCTSDPRIATAYRIVLATLAQGGDDAEAA